MTAQSLITTLVTGVITKSQIPNFHANLKSILIIRKRDKENSAIGKIVQLF
jgi:hypothetical protein